MKTLCIYGCGGMGREIADLSYRINKWEKIIFIDDITKNRVVDEVPVFTFEEALTKFDRTELEFIVSLGEPSLRKLLYEKLDKSNLKYINIIDPNFYLSRLSFINAAIACSV